LLWLKPEELQDLTSVGLNQITQENFRIGFKAHLLLNLNLITRINISVILNQSSTRSSKSRLASHLRTLTDSLAMIKERAKSR
jgi:hypothetical protein